MTNNIPTTLDIIDFIYNNRSHWIFENWTKEQIAIYIRPFYNDNKMVVLFDGTNNAKIEAIIVYEFPEPDKIYIVHLIALLPRSMGKLLDELDTRYPAVKHISGLRKFKREVEFNKSTLRKIYG